MKQLERLLFLQGNRCFFCHQPIPPGEASIEHLVAAANAGSKDDENCVVCCRSMNAALGSLSIKAKIHALLNHRGSLHCPLIGVAGQLVRTSGEVPSHSNEQFDLVVADLQKRGSARPRRLATLRNTINAIFQNKLTEEQVTSVVRHLESKGYIAVQDMKVTYALPNRDA